MVNDIKTFNPINQLVRFADDMTLDVPGNENGDTSQAEVYSIQVWSENNRMSINMEKTYEMIMIVRRNIPALLPDPVILFHLLNERRGKDFRNYIHYKISLPSGICILIKKPVQ